MGVSRIRQFPDGALRLAWRWLIWWRSWKSVAAWRGDGSACEVLTGRTIMRCGVVMLAAL